VLQFRIDWNTGSGRSTELIINANNIVLRVINDNFSTLQFATVLKFAVHYFTYCAQWSPPSRMHRAHELGSCM
jgi:hypothetical protein